MPKGGYRQPFNPAPVSGPGALSKRTDGGAIDGMTQPPRYMAGLGYGEGGNMEQQTGAPLAGNPSPAPTLPDLVPLDAPTRRPDEPLTAGVDYGPGPGSEILASMPNYAPAPSATFRQLAQFDPSGDAELIYRALLDNGY